MNWRQLTGEDVLVIRQALGRALGRELLEEDFGLLLGLKPGNADRSVRRWESGENEVTGAASFAIRMLGYACGVEIPQHALDRGRKDSGIDGIDQQEIADIFRAVMLGIAESVDVGEEAS